MLTALQGMVCGELRIVRSTHLNPYPLSLSVARCRNLTCFDVFRRAGGGVLPLGCWHGVGVSAALCCAVRGVGGWWGGQSGVVVSGRCGVTLAHPVAASRLDTTLWIVIMAWCAP